MDKMNTRSKKFSTISNAVPNGSVSRTEQMRFSVEITSFGFKNGTPPSANILLDVRFLKNPYWVEKLRPLTGLDAPVKKYVLDQPMAQDVLETLVSLVGQIAPAMIETKTDTFLIALGCTGGQHRSPAMVEALGERLEETYPSFTVKRNHRELDGRPSLDGDGDSSEDGKPIDAKQTLTAPRGGKIR